LIDEREAAAKKKASLEKARLKYLKLLVHPARFELATFWFEAKRSIQLS
jgi:hypothetical protein